MGFSVTYVLFGLGLLGLFLGGELLVRGAIGIARRFHVPPMVIGLTIVGFGTSSPELLVSLQAALNGTPAISIGNVVGSNIANILLILGVSALIYPVPLRLAAMPRDVAIMIGGTALLWGMFLGGMLARWEGAVLLTGLLAYLTMSLRSAGSAPPPHDAPPLMPLWLALLNTLGGLLFLMVGAKFLVESASDIARTFGVSEAVIGLTIVAIGTSLPELATSVIAALRRHSEIAVGNIVGSNIFNIFGILGLTALVVPVPVEARFVGLDMIVMVGASLAFLALAALAGRVGRATGGALLLVYAGYMLYLAQG